MIIDTTGGGAGAQTVKWYESFVSAAGQGNTAVATDVALWTLTPIPAGTLVAAGDKVVLTLEVGTGATANSKRLGATVGGTQVNTSNTFATNTARGIVTITVTRVDATHVHVGIGGGIMAPGGSSPIGGASINLAVADLGANPLAIVVTGASPISSAAGDVLLYSGVAETKKSS